MSKNPHIPKRSVRVAGHMTSITLEDIFWGYLHEISGDDGVSKIIEHVDARRDPRQNLSSALRAYLMAHARLALRCARSADTILRTAPAD